MTVRMKKEALKLIQDLQQVVAASEKETDEMVAALVRQQGKFKGVCSQFSESASIDFEDVLDVTAKVNSFRAFLKLIRFKSFSYLTDSDEEDATSELRVTHNLHSDHGGTIQVNEPLDRQDHPPRSTESSAGPEATEECKKKHASEPHEKAANAQEEELVRVLKNVEVPPERCRIPALEESKNTPVVQLSTVELEPGTVEEVCISSFCSPHWLCLHRKSAHLDELNSDINTEWQATFLRRIAADLYAVELRTRGRCTSDLVEDVVRTHPEHVSQVTLSQLSELLASVLPLETRTDTASLPTLRFTVPPSLTLAASPTFVASPSLFFAHFDVAPVLGSLDPLAEMLHYVDAREQKDPERWRMRDVDEGTVCLCRYSQDHALYRAVVVRKESNDRLFVRYIDWGNDEWTSLQHCVLPNHALLQIAPLATACRLAGLRHRQWSDEAVRAFRELLAEQPVLDAVVDVTAGPYECRAGEKPLAVYLTAQGSDLRRKMIAAGLVEGEEDPLREDYEEGRNHYGFDDEDIAMVLTGHRPRDEELVCKYFASGRECYLGDACPRLHQRVPEGVYSAEKEPIYVDVDRLEPPSEKTCVAVEISAVVDPRHLYVQFPFGTKSTLPQLLRGQGSVDSAFFDDCADLLEQLRLDMNEQHRNPHLHALTTLPADGEMVAALYSSTGDWFRGKVVGRRSLEEVKVFYIDWGNSEWLPLHHLRKLEPRFALVPQLAYQASLAGLEAVNWDQEALEYFLALVDNVLLQAYVVSSSMVTCELRLFDTTNTDVNIAQKLLERGFITVTPEEQAAWRQPVFIRVADSPNEDESATRNLPG